jgi:hypothetical protein
MPRAADYVRPKKARAKPKAKTKASAGVVDEDLNKEADDE